MKIRLNPILGFLIANLILLCTLNGTNDKNLNTQETVENENNFLNKHQPWSVRIAQSFVQRHPGSVTYDEFMTKDSWNYEQGVMLESMKKMYDFTQNEQYFNFVQENIDQFVDEKGNIRSYPYTAFNSDHINTGRALLFLYEKTNNVKYKIAADTLRKQIKNQPRTTTGGFWHKKIYPYQMWLDGLYMVEPFYAQYSTMFNEPEYFDDIFNQFNLVYEKTVDQESGLLYHAWNENKEQQWADKETGRSPHFWGRAMGWYLMALVDVLDFIPEDNSRREELYKILQNVSEALVKFRDCETGLWYQVIDMPDREGNYLEASCAAMFTYAFAKGANNGYLDKKFIKIAKDSFESILNYHVKIDENGFVNLFNTCSAAGLGGNPYRDASFAYYISEPTRQNDFKGYGPLLFSAIEIEKANMMK